jgi:hypothetical protein
MAVSRVPLHAGHEVGRGQRTTNRQPVVIASINELDVLALLSCSLLLAHPTGFIIEPKGP